MNLASQGWRRRSQAALSVCRLRFLLNLPVFATFRRDAHT